MVKRFLGFSLMEWIILGLGAVAAFVLWRVFPRDWWRMYICGFGLGFLFEATMEPLFTYNLQLRERHCIGKTDVNFLFPFGWLEILACTCLIAENIGISNRLLAYSAGGIIAGNINEFFFYKSGFWVYHYDAAEFGNFRPFQPKITISGVPVQVVLGYGVVGLMIYCIAYGIF